MPDSLVSCTTVFKDYKPIFYESPILDGAPWADPPISIVFVFLWALCETLYNWANIFIYIYVLKLFLLFLR